MKKLLLATAALAALVGTPALAADMAAPVYKAAPPPAPVWSWTGFYIGINGGGSIGVDNNAAGLSGFPAGALVNPFMSSSGHRALPGGIVGGTVGANWQTGAWVLGVEADWDWSSEKDTFGNAATAFGGIPGVSITYGDQEKIKSIGTARARVGWANDGYLWYVTGGGAWAQMSDTYTLTSSAPAFTFPSPSVGSFSSTKGGYAVGAGVETHLGGNWTAKAEYLYAGFGTVNHTFTTATTAGGTFSVFTSSHSLSDNIVRAGVNYKF